MSYGAIALRIQAGLRQAGHDVESFPGQPIRHDPPATPDIYQGLRSLPDKPRLVPDHGFLQQIVAAADREFLEAVIVNDRGQIVVHNQGCVPREIALLCRLFAHARVLIPADSRSRVESLRRQLSDWLGEPVHAATHKDRKWGTCRIVVCNLQTFAEYPASGWDLVLYPCHREAIHHATIDANLLHCDAAQRFALVPINARLNDRAKLRLEVASGPVIHRQPIRPDTRPVQVAVARSAAMPVPSAALKTARLTAYERKLLLFWANAARNQFIARVAQAFADSDLATLQSHGLLLDGPGNWFDDYDSQPRVTILVEVLEHARRLQAYLPNWQMRTMAPGSLAEQLQEKHSDWMLPTPKQIVTSVYAQNHELHADVIIRADGTGAQWHRNYGPFEHEKDLPLVIVDLVDDFDVQARQDDRRRLRDYEMFGWPVTGLSVNLLDQPNSVKIPKRAQEARAG